MLFFFKSRPHCSFMGMMISHDMLLGRWRLSLELFGRVFMEDVGAEPGSVQLDLEFKPRKCFHSDKLLEWFWLLFWFLDTYRVGWIWGERIQVPTGNGEVKEPAIPWPGPGGGSGSRPANTADHAAVKHALRQALHNHAHGRASGEGDLQRWAGRGQWCCPQLLHSHRSGPPLQWQTAQSGLCPECQQGNAGQQYVSSRLQFKYDNT